MRANVEAIARAAGAKLAREPNPKEVVGLEFGRAGEMFQLLADGERLEVNPAIVLRIFGPQLAHFGGNPPKGVPLLRRFVDRHRYGTSIIFAEAGR